MSDAEAVRRDRLRVVAAGHGGVFTVAEATAAGVTRARLRTLVGHGEWVRVTRGVLAERSVVDRAACDPRARHAVRTAAALLALAHADAAAVKGSAGCVWRLDVGAPDGDRPLLVRPPAPHAGGRTEREVRVLRAGPPEWRVATVGGVRTTDPARTVVDLARTWPTNDAVVAADSALRQYGAVLLPQLRDVAEACRHWPGGGHRVDVVLAALDPRSESALETRGRLAMARDRLPPPATQCWVGELRPELRTDYGWPGRGTVGEADGRVKYVSSDVLWRQARREERLRELGFEVVRFDDAATRRPGELGARFRAAFDRARPGRGRFWPDPGWWSPGEPGPSPTTAWWLWDPDELPSRTVT